VFFRSGRLLTLRWLTVVAWLPVPLTAWLMSIPVPPDQGWETSPIGPAYWWIIPALLIALALVLPASTFLLHDRYVLTFERTEAGGWRVVTWLLWGTRAREFTSEELNGSQVVEEEGKFDSRLTVSVDAPYTRVRLPSGKRLVFDAQCEAPHGWQALEAVFRPRPDRKPKQT
jgi:hypothetical protein